MSRSGSRRGKLWWLVILTLVVAAGAGYTLWPRAEVAGEEPQVLTRSVFVRAGEIGLSTYADAVVAAIQRVDVRSAAAGQVTSVEVEEGQQVETGQAVIRLDDRELQAKLEVAREAALIAQVRLAQAEASLETEELRSASQVRQAEAAVASARLRMGQLVGAAPEEVTAAAAQLRQSEAALELALAEAAAQKEARAQEVAIARAQLNQAEQNVELAHLAVEAATLRSPMDGVVTGLEVSPGEWLGNGAPAFSVARTDPAGVQVVVDEFEIAQVQPGIPVKVRPAAYPDLVFQGRVRSVAPEATSSGGVVTFEVWAEVANPEGLLRPGMTAEAELVVAHRDDALLVPVDAIRETRGGKRVTVVVPGGTEERAVTTGLSDGMYVEVLEGLQEGERVQITMTLPPAGSSTPTAPASTVPGLNLIGPGAGMGGIH